MAGFMSQFDPVPQAPLPGAGSGSLEEYLAMMSGGVPPVVPQAGGSMGTPYSVVPQAGGSMGTPYSVVPNEPGWVDRAQDSLGPFSSLAWPLQIAGAFGGGSPETAPVNPQDMMSQIQSLGPGPQAPMGPSAWEPTPNTGAGVFPQEPTTPVPTAPIQVPGKTPIMIPDQIPQSMAPTPEAAAQVSQQAQIPAPAGSPAAAQATPPSGAVQGPLAPDAAQGAEQGGPGGRQSMIPYLMLALMGLTGGGGANAMLPLLLAGAFGADEGRRSGRMGAPRTEPRSETPE